MEGRFEEEISAPQKKLKYISKNKKRLEKAGEIKLDPHLKQGVVKVKSEDATSLWIAKKVVDSIIKGFRCKDAEKLFNPNTRYVELDLKDFAGRKTKKLWSLKGRIIGRKGASRRKLQKLTDTKIAVSDKTVGIIGKYGDVELARKAIEILLSGANHSTAYKFIRENRI